MGRLLTPQEGKTNFGLPLPNFNKDTKIMRKENRKTVKTNPTDNNNGDTNMNTITINLNDTLVTVTTNDNGMFRLNDIFAHAESEGICTDSKRPSQWRPVRNAIAEQNSTVAIDTVVKFHTINGGDDRGTYTTELNVYKYAAFISEQFEDVVFQAFKCAVNGDGAGAVKLAQSMVIKREIQRKQYSPQTKVFDNAFKKGQFKQKLKYQAISRPAVHTSMVILGVSPSSCLRYTGMSPRDYILNHCNEVVQEAYSVYLSTTTALLSVGMDFKDIEKAAPLTIALFATDVNEARERMAMIKEAFKAA